MGSTSRVVRAPIPPMVTVHSSTPADPSREVAARLLRAAVADARVEVDESEDDGFIGERIDLLRHLDPVAVGDGDLSGEHEHSVHEST